jgi:signal peptidase II
MVFIIDRITKILVQLFCEEGSRHYIIEDFLSITYIVNTGGLFGFLQEQSALFIVLSGILIVTIYWYTKVTKCEGKEKLPWSMILGGATSNLFDRLICGGVIDFLDIGYKGLRWPVFNIADVFIFAGVLLLFFKYKRCTPRS